MKIMVTGAAGGYGHYAVEYVKKFAPEADVYGLIHNPGKAAQLEAKGIHAIVADYSDYNAMVKALTGIDRLLFVSVPAFDMQKVVVEAAKGAGVKFIAYTGIADPQYQKFGLEVNHSQTEALIQKTGITHTFLRDNWYLELIQDQLATSARNGRFSYFTDGKISFALKREYAEAGAKVITGEGYPEIITLAGNAVTFAEIGEALKVAAGKNIEIAQVGRNTFGVETAQSGMSQMGMTLTQLYQDYAANGNNGEADLTSRDFEMVLGHALTPLSDAIKELIG